MKRFTFRLQKVLDLKVREEDSLVNEVVGVNARLAEIRTAIVGAQGELETALAAAAGARQRSAWKEDEIAREAVERISARIQHLQADARMQDELRDEKLAELKEVREFRWMLERLRQKQRRRYDVLLSREEQKFLDETAARRSIA